MKNNTVLYALALVIENAIEACECADKENNSYEIGRSQGYYEALDTLFNALEVRDFDLSELEFKPDDLLNKTWRK